MAWRERQRQHQQRLLVALDHQLGFPYYVEWFNNKGLHG